MYTLVALLGKGQYKKDAGTKDTTSPTRYVFDDGFQVRPQSSCFKLYSNRSTGIS